MRQTVQAWLALLRLPNLFTAPGDPLAGALLAAAAAGMGLPLMPAVMGALAGFCLYASGLVSNDVLGAAEDARERPERPIPSGRVSRHTACAVAIVLNGLGLLCAGKAGVYALAVAGILSLCIWVYNAKASSLPVLRPLLMGACRGLSLLLGAAAIGGSPALTSVPVLIAAVGLTLHVAAITAIAGREVGPEGGVRIPPGLLALSPVVLLLTLGALNFFTWHGLTPVFGPTPAGFPMLVTAMAVVWSAIWCGLLWGRATPAAVRSSIARLVRGILLVQAALCASVGLTGEIVALGLLAAFPVSSWVGAWIKGS